MSRFRDLRLVLKSKNELGYRWNGASTAADFSSGFFIAPNEWTFVAVVIEPAKARLYFNDAEITHNVAHASTSFNAPLTLGADPVDASGYFYGRLDNMRFYDGALSAAEVREVRRGEPSLAWQPSPPPDTQVDLERVAALSWKAGKGAVAHDIYLGADRDRVAAADTGAANIYQKTQSQTFFTPVVLPGTTYHWRIDEVTGDGQVSTGTVWSFHVVDTLIIDDFESYTDVSPQRVWDIWTDGYINDSGSMAGNMDPPYCEFGITHGGGRSMALTYNRDNQSDPLFSEVTLALDAADRDFTRNGSTHLVLWYYGDPTNTAKPSDDLYVALDNSSKVVMAQAGTLQEASWHRVEVALSRFNHPNLSQVITLKIGIGNPSQPAASGNGTIWIDDIGLAVIP